LPAFLLVAFGVVARVLTCLSLKIKMESNVIRCVSGIVTDIHTPFKATIQFRHKGKEERALLKKEKFIYDGRFCASDDFTLNGILVIGSHVKFTAHGHDPMNPPPWADDGHGWYIISAWCEEDEQQMLVRYTPGLVNISVKVASLGTKRQGTLSFEDESGVNQNILFLVRSLFGSLHFLNMYGISNLSSEQRSLVNGSLTLNREAEELCSGKQPEWPSVWRGKPCQSPLGSNLGLRLKQRLPCYLEREWTDKTSPSTTRSATPVTCQSLASPASPF
jgi:hypothetical protein